MKSDYIQNIYFERLTSPESTAKIQTLSNIKPEKAMKRKLPYHQNGLRYGYGANGEKVCTGAKMGRPNIIPADYNGEKLRLRRVPFVDGGYDPGGAYWGSPANLWCAWGETATEQMEVFVRASNRGSAKEAISALCFIHGKPQTCFKA